LSNTVPPFLLSQFFDKSYLESCACQLVKIFLILACIIFTPHALLP